MRLRLNTTLRAALIAAITAVGFTLTQAQAETANATLTPTTSTNNLGGFGAFEFTVGATSPYQPSSGSLDYTTAAPITLNSIDISVYNTWYTNKHSDTGFGGAIYKYDETSSNYVLVSKTNWWKHTAAAYTGTVTLTPVGEQPLVLEQNAVYAVAFYAGETYFNNTLTLGSTTTSFAGAGEWKTTTVPTDTTELAAVGIRGANTNNGITMHPGGTAGASQNYTPNVGLNITYTAPDVKAFTWNGTSDNYAWSASVWKDGEVTGQTFASGSDAVFDDTASFKTVDVTENVTARNVTVSDAYTFNLKDNSSLAADLLTVAGEGASLALTGEGTVAATQIAASGKTINIGEKVVLTGEGSATLDGQGTYALAVGAKAKPADISLATTWKGTVAITNAQFANSDLLAVNSMCNADSWVLLQGTSGWSPSNTFSANLILKNGTNGWAFAQNNGNDGSVLKFTGSIKGDGNLGRSEGKGSTYTYEFTGDIHDWTGQFISNNNNDKYTLFKVSDKATVVAATLVNNNTGAKSDFRVEVNTNAEFTSTVQATSLTVNDSKAATFSEAISIAKDITVGTGATLNVNGGGSIAKAITNNGTLTFGDDITATGLQITAGATGYVDVNGTFSTDGNGFASNSGDSITIAINGEGATLAANGHVVTQGGVDYTIQEDGTAVAANVSTDYSTYYQTNGAVSTSVITSYAEGKGGVCMFAAVTDAGILNVDSAMGYITADGGEVVFQEGGETDGLVVSDNAKVSGLKDISIMMIDAGKTATLDNQVTSGDVVFSATDGVKVTNTGEEEAITYSLEQTDAKVTADTMTVGGEAETEVSNSLVVGEIVNNNAKGLILYGNVENGVTLKAAAGDITMVGQTSNTVTVVDLNIASGNTVTLMDTDQEEGTITVTGVLTGGDATLLSNLTLKGGSTLDVNGGGDSALTLGSMLTFDFTDSNGALVNLDDETIAALNQLEDGGKLNLIVAYTDFDPLTYGDNYQGVSYDQLFSAAGLQGDYTVYAQGDAFGLMKSTSPIPEPTTGTLSLLALAALAARRRRK